MRCSRKPHAAGKHHGSVFYRTGVIADRSFVLHAEIGIFALICSRDLDLDPMTFKYEFDSYPRRSKMGFLRQGFLKLSYYYIQTDRPTGSNENVANDN